MNRYCLSFWIYTSVVCAIAFMVGMLYSDLQWLDLLNTYTRDIEKACTAVPAGTGALAPDPARTAAATL